MYQIQIDNYYRFRMFNGDISGSISSLKESLKVENGVVVSEGRYRNQPLWVAYYDNAHPNDNLYDENGTELLAYEILDHEKRTFPDLRDHDWVVLSEKDDGGLTATMMTRLEYEALEQKVTEDLVSTYRLSA